VEYEILKNLSLQYFERLQKIIMEYYMGDSNPELLEELKNSLISQNY